MVLPADRGDRQLLKMLEALAVVKANGRAPLAEVLASEGLSCGRNAVVMAITPSADDRWVGGLRELRLHGIGVAAVALEASTFGPEGPAQWRDGKSHDPLEATVEASPTGGPGERNSLLLVGALAAADLPTYLVKRGDVLSEVLRGDGRRAMWGDGR
jgi:hypothetical protein